MRLILGLILFFFSLSLFSQNNNSQTAYQHFIKGDYEKAIEIYKELNQKRFSISYYSAYYSSLINLNRFKEAQKLARKASSIYPLGLNYQIDIAVAESNGGKKNVDYQFQKIISKLNGGRNQAINLANSFIRHELYNFALEVYLKSEQKNPKLQFHSYKAQLYSNLGKTDLMLTEYFDLLVIQPNQKDVIISRIQKFVDNDGIKSEKNYQLVKNKLLKYIRDQQDREDFSEILIWLFMQNGNYEMAMRQAIAVDKKSYGSGESVYDIGDLLLDNELYDLAINAFDYLINKGPSNYLYIESNINKLYALTKKAVKEKSNLTLISSKYEEAINQLGINQNTALLLSNYAHFLAFYKHDLLAAEEILQKAISIPAIGPRELAECKIEYADILLLSGKIWESLLFYTQVEKDFKQDVIGHEAKLRRAKVAYFQGDFKWAQAQLDILKASTSKLIANDALELSLLISDNYNLDTSEFPMNAFARAELLQYQRKYDQAIIKYDSILNNFEGHALSDEIYFRKAAIYLSIGEINLTIEMYKKIINEWYFDILLDDAIFSLAKIYDTQLVEPNEAMRLYEKILVEQSGSIYTEAARNRYRALRGDNLPK